MSRLWGRPSNWLLVSAAIYVLLGMFFRWGNLSTNPIIDADGKGYYAYLPALFVYDDLAFGFVDEYESKYYESTHYVHFTHRIGEGVVNKYFLGTSVLMAPFFALGHWAAKVNGIAADGYSWPYQMAVCLAALFWLFFGMWMWTRFLAERGFSPSTQCLTLFAMLFGTGLFYYALAKPSASHVYSTAMVCAALFLSHRVFAQRGRWPLILLGAVLGLIALIRPTNLLVAVALPFVAADFETLRRQLPNRQNRMNWILALLAFAAVCSLQPLMYWFQTGSPWVWSYGEEGFDFAHPEIINVLFSYRKGLFVYTPLALVGLLGVVWRFKKNPLQAGFVTVFFVLATWVISSWWCWYYGGSFGMRPYLEYLPILLMGLPWIMEHALRKWKVVLSCLVLLLAYVNVIQSYQFHQNIMLWDGMNEESYRGIFLSTDRELVGYYYNFPEKWKYVGLDSTVHRHDFSKPKGWRNERILRNQGLSTFPRRESYGPIFSQTLDSLWAQKTELVRVAARVKKQSIRTKASLVLALKDPSNKQIFWDRLPIAPQMTEAGWNDVSHVFLVGKRSPGTTVEAYLYKEDGSSLLLDDMTVTFLQVAVP